MFHTHKWEYQHTKHIQPIRSGPSMTLPADMFQRALWGSEIFVLKCATCGDMKAVEVLGAKF
jgi:hypothetical protein